MRRKFPNGRNTHAKCSVSARFNPCPQSDAFLRHRRKSPKSSCVLQDHSRFNPAICDCSGRHMLGPPVLKRMMVVNIIPEEPRNIKSLGTKNLHSGYIAKRIHLSPFLGCPWVLRIANLHVSAKISVLQHLSQGSLDAV